MVFNDSRTKEEFQIRVWVYVSTKLSVEQIGRSIISQVSLQKRDMVIPQIVGHNLEHADLATLQMLVGMMLSEERCLIVWDEDTNSLGEVKKLLQARTLGSKIIVTTRIKSVANEMNKFFSIQLGRLPYKDCWELFKAEAFPNETVEHQKEKEAVGKEIVKKCDGVPLAVRALGHRLWNKPLRSWVEMLHSDLWEHEQNPMIETISTPVLPSLKISYYYMHRYMRPCFLYFSSAFPKGFTIEKGDLIRRWILPAEISWDVISGGCKCLQDIQTHQTVFFRMNNMIHDLARLVADDEVIVYDATTSKGKYHKERQNCRYKLILNFSGSSQVHDSMPPTVRAIHFKDCRDVHIDFGYLMQAKFLRVLDLNACTGAYILRGCITGWRLLKFLDISGMKTETLPSFLSSLHGLQTLNLSKWAIITGSPSKCASLKLLPPDFGGLQKLSFLDLSHCDELQELPDSFRSLVNMIDLNMSFCHQLKRLPTGFLRTWRSL
ncbi:hypothetical protein U9M48_026839 [Paspalum notatum var. saurae]|uniref:NB-ARC domain-containing protein n=1 Tax=Paspalum notatum var. saurae TaxID=547442 RepID=A0AAQ3TXI5_PASNO